MTKEHIFSIPIKDLPARFLLEQARRDGDEKFLQEIKDRVIEEDAIEIEDLNTEIESLEEYIIFLEKRLAKLVSDKDEN